MEDGLIKVVCLLINQQSVDAEKEINRLKAENDRQKREDKKFEAYKKSLVNNLKGDK